MLNKSTNADVVTKEGRLGKEAQEEKEGMDEKTVRNINTSLQNPLLNYCISATALSEKRRHWK